MPSYKAPKAVDDTENTVSTILRLAEEQIRSRPEFHRAAIKLAAGNLLVSMSVDGWKGGDSRVNSELRRVIGEIAEQYAAAVWQAHMSLLETASLSSSPDAIDRAWNATTAMIDSYIANWQPWLKQDFSSVWSPMYQIAIDAQRLELWTRQAKDSVRPDYVENKTHAQVAGLKSAALASAAPMERHANRAPLVEIKPGIGGITLDLVELFKRLWSRLRSSR